MFFGWWESDFKNTCFEKHLRTAGSDSSYILHRKLNKIIQEVDWPSRLAFCFFWNIKSLYFTYSHSYSFVWSLAVTNCHFLLLVVIRCHLLYHSLSLAVIRCTTCCHSLSLVAIRFHSIFIYVVFLATELHPNTIFF